MAKKSKKKEDETNEVVAKCDNPNEVVANCNNPDEVIANCENQELAVTNCDLKNINIESLIRNIRGQRVMFDSDLAMLYGVTTSRLNEQVKRNINRFPDDFMFQLTKEEWNALRLQIATLEDWKSQNVISNFSDNQQEGVLISQIATSKPKEKRGGTQKLPHVFTRNGIGMLSSVLRSGTAVAVNIRIIDDDVYLLGASVKDMGVGMCAVTKMQVSPETILQLL